MNQSKAFDTINHDILLVKLHAYGFSKTALNLMCSYLENRKQRVQINSFPAKTIIAGVPQSSIGGPLLFQLLINEIVLFLTETMLSNYDDDSNLLSIAKYINKVAEDFGIVTNWFYENFMF